MCMGRKPKTPAATPPAAPPPPPKPVEFGSDEIKSKSKQRTSARKSLSIPLALGGTGGQAGLGIPSK